MSSHHIIKEDQEPALIIANGQSCSNELMGQLLEWSPLVVVLDAAVHRVAALGIKIDVLLGDFDRDIDIDAIRAEQAPIQIVHTFNQDKTDLEKAFDFLIDRGHKAVNVIWATGLRADHHFANIASLANYKAHLKIVIYDDYSKIFMLPPSYQKWYEAQTNISLIPLGEAAGITTQNLKYPLCNETLAIGQRMGNSNEVSADGLVKISYTSGHLLMMECTD
jgi:thiamine pyrophosphokinase